MSLVGKREEFRLNPCSNGMALEQSKKNSIMKTNVTVLILVLMEWRWNITSRTRSMAVGRLNPCSNGMALEHEKERIFQER